MRHEAPAVRLLLAGLAGILGLDAALHPLLAGRLDADLVALRPILGRDRDLAGSTPA